MRRDLIIIGLSPSWLRVAIHGGKKVDAVSLDPADWEETWAKSLRPLDQPLKEALTRLGVSAAHVTVIYQSPQSTAEVFSFPVVGKAAIAAADLSLRESLPVSGAKWASRLKQAHRDQTDKSGAAAAKTHVLAVAENHTNANHLDAWVRRAGLTTSSILPSKASKLAHAVKAAAALPKTGTHAIIWMGDHSTIFAGTSEGRLAFVRSVDFGYSLLSDAIIRAAASLSPASRPHRSHAQRILFDAGIPARGSLMDAASGLRAEAALPLMQSVLQRYAVETKQTLRFSLSEGEFARVSLLLAGPGSQIPNLANMLAGQFDVPVEVMEDKARAAAKPADNDGELVIASGCHELAIVPPAELDRRYGRKLDSSLRFGAAAAVLSLCALGAWTFVESKAIDRQFDELGIRTQAQADHELLREKAARLAGDLASATQAITQTLGDRPRWNSALAALSRLNGPAIEVAEISGGYPNDAKNAPVLSVRGTAWPVERGSDVSGDTLSDFLNRLSKSPLVVSAKVVSTRSTTIRGVEVKNFVVAIQLKALPQASTEANQQTTSRPGGGQPSPLAGGVN